MTLNFIYFFALCILAFNWNTQPKELGKEVGICSLSMYTMFFFFLYNIFLNKKKQVNECYN